MKKLMYYAVSMALTLFCFSNTYAQESEKQTKDAERKESTKNAERKQSERNAERKELERNKSKSVIINNGSDIFRYGKDQKKRSELSLFKKFEGETLSTTKTFDVETPSTSISLFGSVEAGKITIKFILPDGKDYKEFEIDPASDVSWSAQLDETEKEKYLGKWTIQVKIDKVKGYYKLQISTK